MLEKVDFSQEQMKKSDYKPRYDQLIEKLVLLQQQARREGVGLVVLFEGWGGAGKGTRISDLMYNLDARATSVHVTKDFDEDAAKDFAGADYGVTGMYPEMQEFWQALGERGTITLYDRGWYTSAIQRILYNKYGTLDDQKLKKISKQLAKTAEGTPQATRLAMYSDVLGSYGRYAYDFERMLYDDGYIVVKFFLHVREDVRAERVHDLYDNPETRWRVSAEKLESIKDYKRAYEVYDQLLEGSNFDFAPWTLVNGEDKRLANLTIAQTLVDALERGINKKPSAADVAASAKAAANSANDLVAGTQQGESEQEELAADKASSAEDVRAKAEAEAAAQHALAPRMSRFIIMSGYPQIDHTVEKPRIESDEEYHKQLDKEQERLFKLENEMYLKRIPLMLMYEGWDAAGKGGNIKRVAQALDARAYTIFPSPAPTKPELAHPHLWRYWTRLPKAGHVGIYDRSWYGRVLVERIEGFASPSAWGRAYDEINEFEYELVQWGAILLKFWVDVTPEEQLARFKEREENPAKQWKITDEDWRNREKYPQYREAVNDMFRLTSTTFAPWYILDSDDKRYARVTALRMINDALEERLRND